MGKPRSENRELRTEAAAALPRFSVLGSQISVSSWLELDHGAGDVRYLSVPSRTVLNAPTSTGMGFWSINPYIGCEFGCAYCYARQTHRWMVDRAATAVDAPATAQEAATLPASEAFERRILVKQGAAEVLARTLNPARLENRPIVIGTATDPYQPAERRFGLTRALLQTLRNYRDLHIGIITKSALIRRDIPLLAELAKQHRLTVNISLASLDAALLRRLEPRTPIPQARLRALKDLAHAGINVNVLIAPILPGLTDAADALRALVFAAKDAGASWAGGSPLRMGDATRNTLLPWLLRERPLLAERYQRHYARRHHVSPRYAEALKQRLAAIRLEAGFIRTEEWQPRGNVPATIPPQLELTLTTSTASPSIAHPPIRPRFHASMPSRV